MRNITLLFLFVFSVSFSQEQSIKEIKDSITFYLDNAKKENSLSYASRAIILSKRIKSDSLLKESSKKLGYNGFDWANTNSLEEANTHLRDFFF